MFLLFEGDCLEVLKDLESNSIDSIVTDPPYGLSFMGKKWDYDVPSADVWRECLRVLKPGGHLLSFGGTRTYHRLVCAIEDAGFEVRDMVSWIYGSGFPKSLNTTKQIEKGYSCRFIEPAKLVENQFQLIRVESSEAKTDSAAAYVVIRREAGRAQPTGIGVVADLSGQTVISLFESTELTDSNTLLLSKIESVASSRGMNRYITSTELKTIIDLKIWNLLQFPSTLKNTISLNGTSLKPAQEPICLARKPISEKTIAANVLRWNTGALNIDDCRITNDTETNSLSGTTKTNEYCGDCLPSMRKADASLEKSSEESEGPDLRSGLSLGIKDWQQEPTLEKRVHQAGRIQDNTSKQSRHFGTPTCDGSSSGSEANEKRNSTSQEPRPARQPLGKSRTCAQCGHAYYEAPLETVSENRSIAVRQGRFPANLILDEQSAILLDEQSGVLHPGGQKSCGSKNAKSTFGIGIGIERNSIFSDSGGASRFFYVAKTSKRERNEGLGGFPLVQKSQLASKDGGSGGWAKDAEKNPNYPRANHHPTVKPIKLMTYLIRMVTPPGGIVLDPFTGSGSTGVAALKEGFKFIGIEREPEYVAIAQARLSNEIPEAA